MKVKKLLLLASFALALVQSPVWSKQNKEATSEEDKPSTSTFVTVDSSSLSALDTAWIEGKGPYVKTQLVAMSHSLLDYGNAESQLQAGSVFWMLAQTYWQQRTLSPEECEKFALNLSIATTLDYPFLQGGRSMQRSRMAQAATDCLAGQEELLETVQNKARRLLEGSKLAKWTTGEHHHSAASSQASSVVAASAPASEQDSVSNSRPARAGNVADSLDAVGERAQAGIMAVVSSLGIIAVIILGVGFVFHLVTTNAHEHPVEPAGVLTRKAESPVEASVDPVPAPGEGSIEDCLGWLKKHGSKNLPKDAQKVIGEIAAKIEALLPRMDELAEHGIAQTAAKIDIRQIASAYLPQAIAAYKKLPAAFAQSKRIEGHTANELLQEQLQAMSARIQKIEDTLHSGDVETLLAQTKFLNDKYHEVQGVLDMDPHKGD